MSRTLPNSMAGQALRYLRAMDGWVKTTDLAAHLSITAHRIHPNMAAALARGEIEKRKEPNGCVFWRMTPKTVRHFGIDWPPGFVSQFEVRS